MAKLIFQMMVSLDGYINDAGGDFDWGYVDEEVHGHANAEMRRFGLDIYGRRMYETMAVWETYETSSPVEAEFAELWRRTDKIVVSKTLAETSSSRTKIVPSLSLEDMRSLKELQPSGDISVSGPTLAATYLEAGLIDEIGIYYIPVVVGDGTPMFQTKNRLKLERTEETPFANGVIFARYGVLKA